MKTIDEIERMSLDELERVSLDDSVQVPEGLEERLGAALAENLPDSGQEVKTRPGGRFRRPIFLAAGIAASIALIAGLAVTLRPSPLKDTFDDPALAYAEVEKALMKVSDSFEVGVKSVALSQEVFQKPVEVIRSINLENTDNQ